MEAVANVLFIVTVLNKNSVFRDIQTRKILVFRNRPVELQRAVVYNTKKKLLCLVKFKAFADNKSNVLQTMKFAFN